MSKKSSSKPAKPIAASGSPMDVNLLEQIVALMSANDLNTVDVRDGAKRVILKRGQPLPAIGPAPVYNVPAAGLAPANSGVAPVGSSAAPVKAADDSAGLIPIKSPMVGTFYVSSSPDAKPFVSVGSTVDDETDVCIIEAMKVFNNIKAETKGTIAKILLTSGSPVEFGQTLFLVKP